MSDATRDFEAAAALGARAGRSARADCRAAPGADARPSSSSWRPTSWRPGSSARCGIRATGRAAVARRRGRGGAGAAAGARRPARARRRKASGAQARGPFDLAERTCATPRDEAMRVFDDIALAGDRARAPVANCESGHGASPLRALADEDLMQLVRERRRAAFEVVYERHAGRRVLAGLSDDGHALRRRGRGAGGVPLPLALRRPLRPRARLGAHLGARHRPSPRDRRAAARDRARPPPRRATRASRSASRRPSAPTSRPPAARRRATSARALESLPAEQCQVIELAYFGGFTHTEIAEMLDAPVGTVKGRMRLGLQKMRAPSRRRPGGDMTDHDRWVDAAGVLASSAICARMVF